MSRRHSPGAASPLLLLLVPVAVYAASYVELAAYHGRLWLWGTVVHESGRYTLLETTLYASHFLGHLPVLATIALAAAGSWRSLGPPCPPSARRRVAAVAIALALLIAGSLALAVGHFGVEDTTSFVTQNRQRPDLDVEGGSWNLHLPSTMLQLALIPAVVGLARWVFCRPLAARRDGWPLAAAAVLLVVVVTVLANRDPLAAVAVAWSDPRYLAHSVRELATFPLTYYPIPLALLLAGEPPQPGHRPASARTRLVLAGAVAVFAIGFGYQVVAVLGHDIGSLAQQPAFARGGRLGVSYLLASHSFEHVLDSICFSLLTLLFVWGAERCRRADRLG